MAAVMDRRSLLASLGVGAAAAGAAGEAAAQPVAKAQSAVVRPAIRKGLPDVAVIGAGAFGGWAALVLRERGYKVTLVDAYGPGNPHASSGGETRNIRASYGDRGIYTDWTTRAWKLWHEREAEFGRKLIYRSGSIRDPGMAGMAAQIAMFDQMKLPYELLTPEEVNRRWPQIRTDDIPRAFFEVNSGGVKARESMIAVSENFEQKGGRIVLGDAALGRGQGGRLANITIDGAPLSAGEYVFACGPWLKKLFPALINSKIRTPRAELFFVGPARGDQRYRWDNCPSVSDRITYTTADIGGGYKIAARTGDVMADADDDERLPTHHLIPFVQKYVATRLPGLVGRPIIQAYVCQTEHTANGHFIIDRHPDYANLLIAGGGSGHAFKMGPFLGTYLADRVERLPQDAGEAKLFSIDDHGPAVPQPARSGEM
jgi:glycine/D-amino acid oxidase-like deaminating enzyme